MKQKNELMSHMMYILSIFGRGWVVVGVDQWIEQKSTSIYIQENMNKNFVDKQCVTSLMIIIYLDVLHNKC